MSRADDELLALAAKAGGIDTRKAFAPLIHGDDMLLLVVRLDLQLGSSSSTGISWADSEKWGYFEVPHNGNPEAATRRAVVMVAAVAGEALP